jgi:hypothetical protein
MSHVQLESAAQNEVVLAVLAHLENGEKIEATAYFAGNCNFNDQGIGLEFADSRRLADFFKKSALYPDSSLRTDRVLVSGEYVTT